MLSSTDLLRQAKLTQTEITPAEVEGQRKAGIAFTLVDVRESEEYRSGCIAGAVPIPRGFLELRIEKAVPDKTSPLILYCGGGTRSLLSAETLSRMGYENVASLEGGIARWVQEGRPIEKPDLLSQAQRQRYARHLSIPEIGEKGQAALLKSKVLLIGAGGLGSPAAYYLAAAGVGTLGMVDFDTVEESNLQRQILHTERAVGASKIESARATLSRFNSHLNFVPFDERLTSANAERIARDFDLIMDGSDNFPTRYLVNDTCVRLRKACVQGSVYRFEGRITVFNPGRGPCYRCLYPEPPASCLVPSCSEVGVLGVLPGVIGVLQATEIIKLILGIGEPLIGRLITFDGLRGTFQELKIQRNPSCPACF